MSARARVRVPHEREVPWAERSGEYFRMTRTPLRTRVPLFMGMVAWVLLSACSSQTPTPPAATSAPPAAAPTAPAVQATAPAPATGTAAPAAAGAPTGT